VSVAVLLAVSGCGSSGSTPAPTSSAPFTKIDLVPGTGTTATNGRTVTAAYTGWLWDPSKTNGKGTQFDTGTYTFLLGAGGVIAGWDQGIVDMKVGGQRRLTIPPELAYGAAGRSPSIPGNASLVFDITLLAVQ
jgi:FKBP-type peptidyl-prolyl cis-trans isomerase FkpA